MGPPFPQLLRLLPQGLGLGPQPLGLLALAVSLLAEEGDCADAAAITARGYSMLIATPTLHMKAFRITRPPRVVSRGPKPILVPPTVL